MEEVVRDRIITELDTAVACSQLVMVSSIAGGGVTTSLDHWIDRTGGQTFGTGCGDITPQRPLTAFARLVDVDIHAVVERHGLETAADQVVAGFGDDVQSRSLFIDDADRIDQGSARLAAALLRPPHRICLILGHHHSPATHPSLEMLVDAVDPSEISQVVVPPLDRGEVGRFFDDPDRADAALEATGGNPLALTFYSDGAFASVGATILERFDRLSPDGQAIVALLAATPGWLPTTTLSSLGRPWEAQAEALERSGLVIVDPSGLTCRHDKIRRVLYEEMTAVRRRFVHAELLGQLAGSEDLTLVMHHAVGAGDVERIIEVGPRAAEAAEAVGAHREAVGHLRDVLAYEHSVDESERPDLHAALSRCTAAAEE